MMMINFPIIYSGAINKLNAGKFDFEAIILPAQNHHQIKMKHLGAYMAQWFPREIDHFYTGILQPNGFSMDVHRTSFF